MKTDILIIGAGFAGAATAFHLSSAFKGSILVVDKEEIPGYHASGRNASLVLQSVGNPIIRQIVARSREAFTRHAAEIGYNAVGSLQLGSEEALQPLIDVSTVASRLVDADEARSLVPILTGHDFRKGLLTPSDGVMDISRLLQFFLDRARSAGAEVRFNAAVESIEKEGSGFRVKIAGEEIEAGIIVNGAGAWAPSMARLAGIESLPMNSFKRHLFVLDVPRPLDEGWPFVWSIDKNFYFRPESGGLLFSVCDEELSREGFVPTVSPDISEDLADLIGRELPDLEEAAQRRVWSCFRTKTPDGLFHLGWSRELPGFFWVAGLGGHGMGASWEVGRLAAEAILQRA